MNTDKNSYKNSRSIETVCVYCGSADGLRQEYLDAAFAMGQALAVAGLRLVYGAGKTGLMGAVAEGTLQAGGQVTGVVPTLLNTPELIHAGLTVLEVVETIHLRKARMSELADAFIALPGGYGTFEELFETLTWAQIGLHQKPIALLNTLGYYDPLIALVQHALNEGFIYAEHRTLLLNSVDPLELLKQIQQYEIPPGLDRWVKRG
jgi:uncharacterized protein (TIGR00730 family)